MENQKSKHLTTNKQSGQSKSRFFIQYLLSPLLVILIGAYFNMQLEKKKTEIEQVNLAQTMLATIFSDDAYRAFATQRLLEKVLEDTTLNSEIGDIIVTYYEKKIEAYINSGQVDQAQSIVDAAKYVGGRLAIKFNERIEQNPEQNTILGKFEKASLLERQGFTALLSGDIDKAIRAFKEAEATYPSFHQVYEIGKLLESQQDAFQNINSRKQLYKRIATDYGWGAPKDLIRELSERSE